MVYSVMIGTKVSTNTCHQQHIKLFVFHMTRPVQIQIMKLSFFSINLCHFHLCTNAAHRFSVYLQGQNFVTIGKYNLKGEAQLHVKSMLYM